MFRKTFASKFNSATVSLAILGIAFVGISGGSMAEPPITPKTNSTWYNTYAEDAIANAAKREQVIVIRERGLYVPFRHDGQQRRKFFKRHKDGNHAGKVPAARPDHRGFSYNPRAALLRSGIRR